MLKLYFNPVWYIFVYIFDLNCWFAKSEAGSVKLMNRSTKIKDRCSFILICYRTVPQNHQLYSKMSSKFRLKPSITLTAQSATWYLKQCWEVWMTYFKLHLCTDALWGAYCFRPGQRILERCIHIMSELLFNSLGSVRCFIVFKEVSYAQENCI